MADTLEFYDGNKLIACIGSSMVPPEGSFISIRKETWKVVQATFALDHADEPAFKSMRCNIDLEKP